MRGALANNLHNKRRGLKSPLLNDRLRGVTKCDTLICVVKCDGIIFD